MEKYYLVFFILLIPVFVLAVKPQGTLQKTPITVITSQPSAVSVPLSVVLGRPTTSTITTNVRMGDIGGGSQAQAYLEYGSGGGVFPLQTNTVSLGPNETREFLLTGLMSDSVYSYRVRVMPPGGIDYEATPEYTFPTQRTYNSNFIFALITDSHITFNGTNIETLKGITRNLAGYSPDFVVALGDNIQTPASTGCGNSCPIPNETTGRKLYSNLREAVSEISPNIPFYLVIGNWEGENGWFNQSQIDFARGFRMAYFPNPDQTTYVQSGSQYQDYYSWTWGDALFITLNVMTYTPTDHRLFQGEADDWTLGQQQLDWLNQTLISNSNKKWKFIFIHHSVGGNAVFPWDAGSRYGRGGGRAAYVGEQAVVHRMMRDNGVDVFFHGHDHCFVDMVVDGIHYSQPGVAGDSFEFCDESGHPEGIRSKGHAIVTVTRNTAVVDFFDQSNLRIGGYVIDKTPTGGPSGSPLIMKQAPGYVIVPPHGSAK